MSKHTKCKNFNCVGPVKLTMCQCPYFDFLPDHIQQRARCKSFSSFLSHQSKVVLSCLSYRRLQLSSSALWAMGLPCPRLHLVVVENPWVQQPPQAPIWAP